MCSFKMNEAIPEVQLFFYICMFCLSTWIHPRFFGGVRVAHYVNIWCCGFSFFFFVFTLCLVSHAACDFGLSPFFALCLVSHAARDFGLSPASIFPNVYILISISPLSFRSTDRYTQ